MRCENYLRCIDGTRNASFCFGLPLACSQWRCNVGLLCSSTLGKDQSGLEVEVRVARKTVLSQYSREAILPSFPVFSFGSVDGQSPPAGVLYTSRHSLRLPPPPNPSPLCCRYAFERVFVAGPAIGLNNTTYPCGKTEKKPIKSPRNSLLDLSDAWK